MLTASVDNKINDKKFVEKFIRRIDREFKKCKYIGDIHISDEEYGILKNFLKLGYDRICKTVNHESINPLFAVAMVQIGIRYYDGGFWPHVKKELGIDMPQNHQTWLGENFYKILIRYGKLHVDKNEFVNNILMHCFITKHYADDLFDFLFAYYQIDLDRDLSNNNKDMRNYLMQSMSKSESSARSYQIKKHTSDAVLANEKGCKIRVGKILRFMDNALFYDIYPTNSQNRIAQLFCSWAASSNKFDFEKKQVSGLTHKGMKRYSTPYINFDVNSSKFFITLPPQYIRLEDDEVLPEITWKIFVGNQEYVLNANVNSCVTGCKTERISHFSLEAEMLMEEMRFELFKNGEERIQRFKVKSDDIRFFDDNWDLIDSVAYNNYLPVGQAYAFVEESLEIVSDSDMIVGCERALGYKLYTLELEKGDILRLPNGRAKSVGKPLEEGILSQSLVSGAYAITDAGKYFIYSEIPSVYFRMKPTQENGTLFLINGEKYRFDIDKCVRFDLDEKTDEKGYVINLSAYAFNNGIYNLKIDVPNSRKDRDFNFAIIKNFKFEFNSAAYIFEQNGSIEFSQDALIQSKDAFVVKNENKFDFEISADVEELSFVVSSNDEQINIQIDLPVLKWKFDDGEWNIRKPEEIWHKEFPKTIWIKYPDDQIAFSMTPIILNDADDIDEEDAFEVSFSKSKQDNIFECDTRKIKSWFGYEENQRTLFIEINNVKILFANVLLKNYIKSCQIVRNNDNENDVLKIKCEGKDSCVLDVFQNGQKIYDKKNVSLDSIFAIPGSSERNIYKIILYKIEEEEFGSESETYVKCDERNYCFNNLGDLTRKKIKIIAGRIDNYKHTFEGIYVVENLKFIDTNIYSGVLLEKKLNYGFNKSGNVIVEFITKQSVKLKFIDSQADFYYAKLSGALYFMTSQMFALSSNPFSYINLKDAYYDIIIEEIDSTNDFSSKYMMKVLKKYNYPLDKTNISKSVLRKLERNNIYTTDQIVNYGLDRLCTIPKITTEDALYILSFLQECSYRIFNIEELKKHYGKD